MKFLILFAALVVCASSKKAVRCIRLQDTAGNYYLEYDFDGSARQEEGFANGTVVGKYSFKDKEGGFHEVKFNVGADGGYRAEGDVPKDTPAVAAVRAAHIAEGDRLRSILPTLKE